MKIEHNNERVNLHKDIVHKTPQNIKNDEEVDGINWNALPNKYGKES